MRGKIRHLEAMRFLASANSHHAMILDASNGEEGVLGPSPMETVMLAAGCCSAMDVVYILKRMRQPLEDLEVEVEAQRAEGHPAVFTSLELRYRASGHGLQKKSLERAIRLSREKYCSVVIMLERAGVTISTRYRID